MRLLLTELISGEFYLLAERKASKKEKKNLFSMGPVCTKQKSTSEYLFPFASYQARSCTLYTHARVLIIGSGFSIVHMYRKRNHVYQSEHDPKTLLIFEESLKGAGNLGKIFCQSETALLGSHFLPFAKMK